MDRIIVLLWVFLALPAVAHAACNPLCDPHATCVNNFTCVCNVGYSGNGRICTPIDVCLMNPCDPHATCTFTGPGTYSCACNMGYSGDGRMCSPVADLAIAPDLAMPDFAMPDLAMPDLVSIHLAPADDLGSAAPDLRAASGATVGGCSLAGNASSAPVALQLAVVLALGTLRRRRPR